MCAAPAISSRGSPGAEDASDDFHRPWLRVHRPPHRAFPRAFLSILCLSLPLRLHFFSFMRPHWHRMHICLSMSTNSLVVSLLQHNHIRHCILQSYCESNNFFWRLSFTHKPLHPTARGLRGLSARCLSSNLKTRTDFYISDARFTASKQKNNPS